MAGKSPHLPSTRAFHCWNLGWQRPQPRQPIPTLPRDGKASHCRVCSVSASVHTLNACRGSAPVRTAFLKKAILVSPGRTHPLVQPHLEEHSLAILLNHCHTDFFYPTDLLWNVAECARCDICTVCPTNWKTRCDLFPRRLSAVSKQEQTSVISDWLHFKTVSQMYLGCVFHVPLISFKLTFFI